MRKKRSHALLLWNSVRPFTLDFVIVVGSLLLLIALFAHSACHAATNADHVTKLRPQTLPEFVEGIVERSSGMVFISEQDSEVFAFYRNTRIKELTGPAFLGLLRRHPQTPIFEQSWQPFFAIRIRNDPTGRWENLYEYLDGSLSDAVVFRVPREAPYTAQYDLYAVGLFNGHTVVGVQMFGVAT